MEEASKFIFSSNDVLTAFSFNSLIKVSPSSNFSKSDI
jgi:hypothetical protein